MQTVSADYKTDIEKSLRNYSFIKVLINMSDPATAETNSTTDNGHTYYSEVELTDAAIVVPNTYATMERNRLVLDGSQVFPPEVGSPIDIYQGFVGSEISNDLGTFTTSPKITTTFATYTHFAALSFQFDKLMNCYPTEIEIKSYSDSTLVDTVTYNPTTYEFITPLGVPSSGLCNKIEVTFKAMSVPHRRARLSYLIFGIMKEWSDNTITDSTWSRETDLLSSMMPTNAFQFTSIDLAMEYNPDNPVGMWQYIEQLQPMTIMYGYQLDSGIVEWVTAGHLYTNGEMESKSSGSISSITFFGESMLEQLTDVYYKGVYSASPVSLASLATEVFTFAGLSNLSDGGMPYYIDPALSTIMTSSPLPELPINEVLQLIANAGRCVLYTNRDGRINLRRIPETLTDFVMNFDNMTSIPTVSKIPALLSVSTTYDLFKVATTTTSILKTDLVLATNTVLILPYTNEAVGSSYTVTGTLVATVAPVYYANSCIVTLTGTGSFEVMGYVITRTQVPFVQQISTVGYDCPMANQLINNLTDATNYAIWVGSILSRSNEYSFSDRGYPELDTLDTITAQTLFSSAIEASITKYKLKYNGALSADTTMLSK